MWWEKKAPKGRLTSKAPPRDGALQAFGSQRLSLLARDWDKPQTFSLPMRSINLRNDEMRL